MINNKVHLYEKKSHLEHISFYFVGAVTHEFPMQTHLQTKCDWRLLKVIQPRSSWLEQYEN